MHGEEERQSQELGSAVCSDVRKHLSGSRKLGDRKEAQSEGETKDLLVRREKRASKLRGYVSLRETRRSLSAGPEWPFPWLPSVPGSGPVYARLENPLVRWPTGL